MVGRPNSKGVQHETQVCWSISTPPTLQMCNVALSFADANRHVAAREKEVLPRGNKSSNPKHLALNELILGYYGIAVVLGMPGAKT